MASRKIFQDDILISIKFFLTLHFKVLFDHSNTRFKERMIMNIKSIILDALGWFFAVIFFGIGLVNMFWGNDPVFGVFIGLLSLVYVPQLNTLLKKITGLRVHFVLKILLGIFILWAALGVGELFDKINMMSGSF